MLTRHERKERLGHGGLKRVAARTARADGKPYSLSRVSQVVNCEKTGERNPVIEAAVVLEINQQDRDNGLIRDEPLAHADVFPPADQPRPSTSGVRFPLAIVGE